VFSSIGCGSVRTSKEHLTMMLLSNAQCSWEETLWQTKNFTRSGKHRTELPRRMISLSNQVALCVVEQGSVVYAAAEHPYLLTGGSIWSFLCYLHVSPIHLRPAVGHVSIQEPASTSVLIFTTQWLLWVHSAVDWDTTHVLHEVVYSYMSWLFNDRWYFYRWYFGPYPPQK